jgi:hypothetical protein
MVWRAEDRPAVSLQIRCQPPPHRHPYGRHHRIEFELPVLCRNTTGFFAAQVQAQIFCGPLSSGEVLGPSRHEERKLSNDRRREEDNGQH